MGMGFSLATLMYLTRKNSKEIRLIFIILFLVWTLILGIKSTHMRNTSAEIQGVVNLNFDNNER